MMVIVSLIRIEVDKTGNTENQLYKSYEDSTQKKSKKKRTDKPRFISLANDTISMERLHAIWFVILNLSNCKGARSNRRK